MRAEASAFIPSTDVVMPLHDCGDDRGRSSLHIVWQAQLLDWIQPRLPAGYRAYLGSVPALTIHTPNGRPALGVRNWESEPASVSNGSPPTPEPDSEAVATFELDPQTAVQIDLHGRLIAAIEIVSHGTKTDRTPENATSGGISATSGRASTWW